MRSSQIIWVSPKSNKKVLVRDKSGRGYRKEESPYRWRLRLELCSCRLRNAWRHQSCKRQESDSPQSLQRGGLCQNLGFRLWPPELWESKFLLFLKTTQFVVVCYGSHRKLIQYCYHFQTMQRPLIFSIKCFS